MTSNSAVAVRDAKIDVSFIIPVRNDAVGLARCLHSIRRACSASISVETIVVDNGSSDGTVAVAQDFGATVVVVPNEPVAALRNQGAATARGALLAFVDADHELDQHWLTAALDALSDPAVSAAGAPYSLPPAPTWVQRTYNGLRDHAAGRRVVNWMGSGNLVVRGDVFRAVGGFDTSLEACEDVDFCRRIRETGGALVSDSRLRSVHHGDPATLSGLFRAELWRGRDNLRVSLRERLTLRSLLSIAVPIFDLALLTVLFIGLVTLQPVIALVAFILILMPSAARSVAIRKRGRVSLWQAFAVAVTYDIARAGALVFRVGHRRGRPKPATT
jgi:glycosyltransferase involved in cell wall biosynthesis